MTQRTPVHRLQVATELHQFIENKVLPGTGVDCWLLAHPLFSARAGNPYHDAAGVPWPDNAERFLLLSRAAAALCAGVPALDWRPDILHGNDWHTGPAIALARRLPVPPLTVFTIHNLAHLGLFDRATFDATLIDKSGAEIRKSSLSAGEKQVYAIAMLWALARTSGRALPMIIDTPLARLDSEHRSTIVERYFPEASHQVIVLSTDTEVDDRLLEKLAPSISHSFRLEYEHDRRATHVVPGYFEHDDTERHDVVQQA